MYQSEELPVVEPAERLAEKESLADRMVYRGLMEAAERFAAGAGLIVRGRAATRLLLGDPADTDRPPPIGLDSFQYEFFSAEAPRQAKALADALWEAEPEGLGHYATMLSKVPGQLMLVLADGRALFAIQSLPPLRGAPLAEVVGPVRRPAQFARAGTGEPLALLCVGADLQLIETYAALSSPAKAAEWGGLLSVEAALRGLYESEAEEKHARALSRGAALRARGAAEARGGEEGGRSEEWGAPEGHPGDLWFPQALGPPLEDGVLRLAARAGPDTARLRRALLDHYAAGPGRVLVGPFAIATMTGEGQGGMPQGRVQVVAAGGLEAEAEAARAVAQRLGFSADWSVNDPKCPVDSRLRRATVYVARGGRREPVLDIYNTAEHELVPYATVASWEAARGGLRASSARAGGGERGAAGARGPPECPDPPVLSSPDPSLLKVGTPFVQMRFLLVDMWTVQVLLRMGAVSGGHAAGVMAGMLRQFRRVAELYTDLLALFAEAGPRSVAGACLLPLAHKGGAAYVGRLEDPELAMRREAASRPDQKRYPAYYPAARRAAQGGAAPAGWRCCEDYAPSRAGADGPGLASRAGWDDAWSAEGAGSLGPP